MKTGVTRTVRDLVNYTFKALDLNPDGYVKTSAKFERPEELNLLKGDSTKLRTKLGWKPEYRFEDLIDEMIWVAANKDNKSVETFKI